MSCMLLDDNFVAVVIVYALRQCWNRTYLWRFTALHCSYVADFAEQNAGQLKEKKKSELYYL